MEKEVQATKTNDEVEESIRMAYNENPYGASPKALKAVTDNLSLISQYPPMDQVDLKNKIAKKYSLNAGNVCLAAGSVNIIDILIKNFVSREENMVIPRISFVAYKLLAERYHVETRNAEMSNYGIDLEAIYNLLDDKSRLVFLANPNNPTGTALDHNDIHSFLKKISPKLYVVIDEAYVEYMKNKDLLRSRDFVTEFENVILLRSFSKAYGLAGLRIGYAISSQSIIDRLNNYLVPFSVTRLSALAAMAAMEDSQFLENSIEKNRIEREWLLEKLNMLGFNVIPTEGNFLFLHFSDSGQRDMVHDRLITKAGISTKKTDQFGDVNSLRITVGNHDDNEKLIYYLHDEYHMI